MGRRRGYLEYNWRTSSRGKAVSGDFQIGSCVVQPSLNSIVCNGKVIRLEPKMMEVLVCLAEKQGEVISKEQLIGTVWANTFVTDDVLTRCISELRRALQDDAKEPRVIETIPRRGYRVVAAVQPVAPTPAAVLESPRAAEARGRISAKGRWLLLGGTAVVVGAIFAGTYLFRHRGPVPTSKGPIVVADFTNTTGDAVFDETLRQGLVAQLQQSPYLEILSDEQVAGTMRLMSQLAGARLTHELARQVCQRTGGAAVLNGSIAQIGSQYDLTLNAENCSTGGLLASAQEVARDKNHVLGALDTVASSIRGKLGESLASVQKFNVPLEEVTTPSLEALQAYTLGWKSNLNGDYPVAVGSFERAISLDPNFAMAYAVLGTVQFNLNEITLASENTQKAYELCARVSEREKFYISSHYQILVAGDLEKAIQAFDLWAQTYPQDAIPPSDLAVHYLILGLYQKALAPARRALELDPDSAMNYENLADSYLCLDRLDDAGGVLQRARARGIDSLQIRSSAYELAFLKGNTAEMAHQAAWADNRPGIEDLFLDYESGTAAYIGHLAQANRLAARAIASARQAGQRETAATYQAEAALREALVGNAAEAQKQATAAWRASNGRNSEATTALALALAGNLPQAQKLVDDLAMRFPQDTIAQFNYLPTIRAAVALGQNLPAKAISELQPALPYELGTPALLIFLNLYPVYVRGQAHLAARQGTAAAAEFQRILDHAGIAFNEIIFPLAHLQIGRAYAVEGNTAKARAAYKDFLTLWKDADPDIPILKQAKAEYAKLR